MPGAALHLLLHLPRNRPVAYTKLGRGVDADTGVDIGPE